MRERVDAISDWAELSDFIDVPLRSYSTGMMARLGFAVATDVRPDVLVVDEVLSVGDTAFQEKSKKRMLELIDSGAAVLFVSHQIGHHQGDGESSALVGSRTHPHGGGPRRGC